MEKPKFHLNPNEEIVKTIREGLKRTGRILPLPSAAYPGKYLHLQRVQAQLGRPGLSRPLPLRPVCEGLRAVPKLIKIGRYPSATGGCLPILFVQRRYTQAVQGILRQDDMPVCIGIGRVDCAGLGSAVGNPVGQCPALLHR